ncbi:MAG TPA: hypothetical protein VGL14_08630 [Methylomirabilota bacterium]|jgi:hypothetical protein
MSVDTFLRNLVTEVEPNGTVVAIEGGLSTYHVSVAWPPGVVADCELPRDAVAAAQPNGQARERVASVLKRNSDDVVAPVGDGRA